MVPSKTPNAIPQVMGRPRNEVTRELILRTTLSLLEKKTLESISVEGIAKAAGVSKATIYRWWKSKVLIVIDAFIELHVINTPMRHDLPPREAIARHMRSLAKQYTGLGGHIVAQIIAGAQADPEIRREFHDRFHNSRRAVVREALEKWRESGEIDPEIDIEILMDVLYAPIYMRLLIGHAPLNDRFTIDLQNFLFPLLELSNTCRSIQEQDK